MVSMGMYWVTGELRVYMKHTIVPAQITTVEDRIAGSLTLQQLTLLSAPIFVDFTIFALLPDALKPTLYKFVLMLMATALFCIAAIRVRGKLLVYWIMTITKYNLRPKYYVFNKNDHYLRKPKEIYIVQEKEHVPIIRPFKKSVRKMSDKDVFEINQLLGQASFNLRFISKKKEGLHVHVTEIQ